MTALNTLTDSAAAVRLTPRAVIEAWRGITRRELWATFLLGCALYLFHAGTGLALLGGARGVPIMFVGQQIHAFGLLLAFVVVDRVTGKDPGRRGAYALAILVGAAFSSYVVLLYTVTMVNRFVQPLDFPGIGFFLYAYLDLVMIVGAAVWVILDRRRASLARERMRRAELERIDAEKRSVESDLQAMQARVEPQFLFDTLAQVKRLYEQDPAVAERMLDDLIAYLRAAMPKMRDTSSTVGQEIELAHAYLDILRTSFGNRLDLAIETSDEVADARFPPMMLLPLLEHAVRQGSASGRANEESSIRISAEARAGRLLLTVSHTWGVSVNAVADGVADIEERLGALFGGDASLELRSRTAGGTDAVIEIPLEVAATPARAPARE